METPAFWRDLQTQFRALSVEGGDLLYAIDVEDGSWILAGGPDRNPQRHSIDKLFRALAKRSAIGAGLSDGVDPIDSWLNRLRGGAYFSPMSVTSEGPNGSSRVFEGGRIERLPTASAEYCVELEAEAFKVSRSRPPDSSPRMASSTIGGPKLADWLDAQMTARGPMSVNRLVTASGIDRKTILKILAGKRVLGIAIPKLAIGLSRDGAAVSPSDIPRD